MMRMTLLNNANKLSSKYASSNYLNDYSSNQCQLQPQQTRTTPRRRTPRNAEEFLMAAGIVDTETYLSKGYYVGSMLNLSEFTLNANMSVNQANALNNMQQEQQEQQEANADLLQNPSSSSSSSINGFKNHQKPYFLEPSSISNANLKRRNSIHETTSLSLANLAYLNENESNIISKGNNSLSSNQYYRASSNYNKIRAMTTAIVSSNQNQYDDMGNQSDPIHGDGNSTSNGSSAPGSDSSSSPTPSIQQKMNFSGGGNGGGNSLGPLMSAVSKMSKMENLSNLSPSSSSNKTMNTFLDQRYFNSNNNDEEFDDYEYLERNLGAEPLNSSYCQSQRKSSKMKQGVNDTNTTTNTNVTDYYTDESNSCHNEDFKTSHQFLNMEKKYHDFNQSSSSSVNTNSNLVNGSKNSALAQAQNGINYNGSGNGNNANLNPNSNNMSVNNNVNANNAWDHTSLASTNSLYSGLCIFLKNKKITFLFLIFFAQF